MKNLFLFLLLMPALWASAQISAITQDGRKVILYSDHTWRYSDADATTNAEGLSKLEVDSNGSVWVYFSHAGKTLIMCNGKIISNEFQSVELKYNDRFDGFEGKLKSVTTDGKKISFTYNDAVDRNEGKLKAIQCDDRRFNITYYDIFDGAFAPKGRVKSISTGSESVQFRYNDRYDGSEGKLKSITGSITGVIIRYLD